MKAYRLGDLSREFVEQLCCRNPIADPSVMETCRTIFDDISARGDEAVRQYTRQFDGVEIREIGVPMAEFSQARHNVSSQVVRALERAAQNIRKFHAAQQISEKPLEVEPGVCCWRESRPIDSVGLYVPGGNVILPSTVLMLGIPAQLAGCPSIILCVPPQDDLRISPEVLLAAEIAGISQVFTIGGAQAIAAMALGTETVPKVDKILGPGSRWVQTAKLLATLKGIAIDMVAGPTEVLVISDDSAAPEWVASDLISQAEHGSDSRAVLVSTSSQVLEEVAQLVWHQIQDLPRKNFASESLRSSFGLLAESMEEAFDFANLYAPEHLILHLETPKQWIKKVRCAGSVFLGAWSPEVAGDYASGTNHTLPTSGLARAFSGVSLDSFVKKITFQELTSQGLQQLAPTLETLAELESLEGHRRAVRVRLNSECRIQDSESRIQNPESRIQNSEAPNSELKTQNSELKTHRSTAQKLESSKAQHPGYNNYKIDITQLIRPNILNLEPYHCAREKIQEGILLDANENPYSQEWEGVQLNRYPDPFQCRLRETIARYLGIRVENVAAGAGSDEVLDWIFKVFCRPGQDRIAIAEPTYGMYRVTANVFGIPSFEFRLDKRFDFNAKQFLKVVSDDTKVLFLCSPNNPTGNLLDRRQIFHLCRKWKGIVMVDEAYIEFADQPSLVMELQEVPNLILLRTLSKAFGRAAIRLGYAVASAQIISHFLRVKAPYNLNALSMENGCRVLSQPASHLIHVEEIRKERDRVAECLREIPQIEKVFPSQANFLLFRCPGATQICKRLLQKGIVVRDRSLLPGLKNCIRVSIGISSENDLFLGELQRIVKGIL
ncbi:histidinol dehydrogenase [Acidobacteria bacterium AH-259-L09]|nr:histidinol dehydrogenase [Acidobacteria bacterium AH-259-L09]